MRKKLIDFLPPEIREVEEFKEIMLTEDIEIESLERNKQRILDESFIDTATEFGIRDREKLYKIRFSPFESLDMRKLRLKNRKMDKLPITYRTLLYKLKSLFGEDNCKITIDNDNYIVNVELSTFDWNAFNEIVDNFRCIIPCDMILKSLLINKINTNLYIGACTLCGEEIVVYPWSPKDIESKGKVNIAMTQNSGVESITIYPK